jgi:uncharacterized protein YecE (DUF72 family)
MINIGLTGWGDHEELYVDKVPSRDKLKVYSSYFPIVEVDSSFYAIQPGSNYIKWAKDTPDSFSFIVKAYQGMTGHLREENPFSGIGEMFDAFKKSIEPLIEAGKLKAVLFQYPPWFECRGKNIGILRYTKEKMGDIPIALEFRNQTWFVPDMKEKTLSFMEAEGWIHSICDEPQAGTGSIPIILHTTNESVTIVRFHGRNVYGWNDRGHQNWREVRYLYRYNKEELLEWKERLEFLQTKSKEICVLFNNNSGGDAAANAKQLIDLLGIEYEDLGPRQLKLF